MSNGHDSADNVISMDHLRRAKRRSRRKIKKVEPVQAREATPSSGRREPAPSSRGVRTAAPANPADSGKVVAALAAAFVIVAAFLFAAVMMTGFFDVKTIELRGIEEQHREEILTRAGLSEGMNILGFTAGSVKAAIEEDPSLAFISCERVFPDTIILSLERRGAVCSVYHLGSYVKLDRNYQVLGLEPTDTSMGQYPVIHGLTLGIANVGDTLEFEDSAQEDAIRQIIDGLRGSNALQYVQQIHVSNLSEIYMLADNDIHVDVGNFQDMEIKATWISYMVPKLIGEGYEGGSLYVSGGRNASYSPEKAEPPIDTTPLPDLTPIPETTPESPE